MICMIFPAIPERRPGGFLARYRLQQLANLDRLELVVAKTEVRHRIEGAIASMLGAGVDRLEALLAWRIADPIHLDAVQLVVVEAERTLGSVQLVALGMLLAGGDPAHVDGPHAASREAAEQRHDVVGGHLSARRVVGDLLLRPVREAAHPGSTGVRP